MLLTDHSVWNIALLTALGISWLALFMAIFCVMRLRKQAASAQKLYQQLETSVTLANKSSLGMGKKLLVLEKRLQTIQGGSDSVVSSRTSAAKVNSSGANKMTSADMVSAAKRFSQTLAETASHLSNSASEDQQLNGNDGESQTALASQKQGVSSNLFAADLKDAALLLNAGLDADEVARRCGISKAEASLMKMIHNHSFSAA